MQIAERNVAMRIRFLISIFIPILFILVFYSLFFRLISQTYYQKANNYIRDGYHDLAVNHLEKAIHHQKDNSLIWKKLGEVCHNLAGLKPLKEAFLLTKKAKDAYLIARRLNPLDANASYGLAREEARLEQMYPYLRFNRYDNPYQAFPYFQEAIRLRPNCVLYHYALAQYLFRQKRTEAFLEEISKLVHIYPSAYSSIKKEAFWSPEVRDAVKKGLKKAIEDDIDTQNAHIAMSTILAGEKDWAGAISHYQEALARQAVDIRSGNFLHLGRLYLENMQLNIAEKWFIKALSISSTREKDLEGLFGIYKRNGYEEELYQFYDRIRKNFVLSSRIDILLARSLIDLKRYHQARQILEDLNQKDPTAEGYYLLAQIARKEKDWDSMELSIQRATVLDQGNSRYHLVFSQVLKRLKKLDRAEKEASLAIKHSLKPSPWLFSHRASLRWTKKDYRGALKDWQMAIKLKPDRAGFYVQTAEAFKKLGDLSLAIDYYKKALKLEPENNHYQKRYIELKEK